MIKIAMICQQGEKCEVLWWVTDQEVERCIKQYTGGLLHSRRINREPMVRQPLRIQATINIRWPTTNVNIYMYNILFRPTSFQHTGNTSTGIKFIKLSILYTRPPNKQLPRYDY
jgi:hypothetical protein